MGFHIPWFDNKRIYIRNPFKVIRKEEPRMVEDEQEFVDTFVKPTVTMSESDVSVRKVFFSETQPSYVARVKDEDK